MRIKIAAWALALVNGLAIGTALATPTADAPAQALAIKRRGTSTHGNAGLAAMPRQVDTARLRRRMIDPSAFLAEDCPAECA